MAQVSSIPQGKIGNAGAVHGSDLTVKLPVWALSCVLTSVKIGAVRTVRGADLNPLLVDDSSLSSHPTTRNKLIANLYLLPSPELQIYILSASCGFLFGEQLKANLSQAFIHLFNKCLPNAYWESEAKHEWSIT